MKPSYTLHLATLFTVLAVVLGACNISPQMKSGRYFEYYSQPRSSVSRWYISYDTTTIESGLYASDVATDPVITTGYTCLSQHFVDNTFYFHEQIDSSQTYFCTKVTISGNALLVQRHQPVASNIPASRCPTLITGDAYWQVKESNPVVTIPWPFTQGTYRATYEVLNADFPFCTGSVTSTAIVSGSSVTIDSCYRDIVRIDTPFRGTFTALASLPGDALDHNIHGDLLLVSAQLHQVNSPRYYCARYSEGEANGVREFYFILYISDERYITCKVNNLIDVPFVKFTFKQMPITTPNPNGTPAPTDPPTAPPVFTPPPAPHLRTTSTVAPVVTPPPTPSSAASSAASSAPTTATDIPTTVPTTQPPETTATTISLSPTTSSTSEATTASTTEPTTSPTTEATTASTSAPSTQTSEPPTTTTSATTVATSEATTQGYSNVEEVQPSSTSLHLSKNELMELSTNMKSLMSKVDDASDRVNILLSQGFDSIGRKLDLAERSFLLDGDDAQHILDALDKSYLRANEARANPIPGMGQHFGTCGSAYDGVQWWNGAGANGVTFTQEFRGDELIRKANDLEIEKISCYDQYTDQHSAEDHMYILRHHSSDFNERQCVIYYPTDQPSVVLERELDAGLSIYTANQCVAPLLRQGYRITALINSATLDISAGRLPADIPRRSFNANFVESLEGGNRCLNDLESTIVTTDNTITFNLCTTDNTYERPHNTELRVVATWEEDLVDDQQGVADGRGNFILLTYDDNGTNKYICARYTVESTIEEVSFYMSLMRSQPNGAICNTEASSKTFGISGGNQYTTYLFYYYTGEFAATQPPVYITTPSAPCGPTAGGSQCLNGGNCQHAINQYVCVCGPGFTGAQCETALPEGDCRECASGQTERCVPDRGYYYCHCADGFYGQQCQVDYDECASDPCQNGGECVDQVNKFICECTGDFDGTHCHLELSNKDSDQTLIIIIVVVVAIVVALVVITAVAICQIRRRRRMLKNADDTEMMEKAPSDKGDGTGDNYATANAWFADYKQDGSAPTANSKMEMD